MRSANQADFKWVKASKKLANQAIPEDEDIANALQIYQEILILEDFNKRFETGFGPVGIVGAMSNGYLYVPHVDWFHWATSKNKIRCSVMFFQKFRYRNLGVIRVHALKDSTAFFSRLKKYVPLYFVGKIPGGDEAGRGDDHIFYLKCRGSYELAI